MVTFWYKRRYFLYAVRSTQYAVCVHKPAHMGCVLGFQVPVVEKITFPKLAFWFACTRVARSWLKMRCCLGFHLSSTCVRHIPRVMVGQGPLGTA